MKKVLVLGAGQLARMMELAGTPLNLDVKALDVLSNKVVAQKLLLYFIKDI